MPARLPRDRTTTPAADAPLTPAERRFAEEYAARPNGTQAYRRAYPGCGYATAKSEASRLLTKPNLRAAVEAGRAAYRRWLRVGSARVLGELAAVAFFDWADVLTDDASGGGRAIVRPWADIPPAARRAIRSVKVRRRRVAGGAAGDAGGEVEEVEVTAHDRLAALDMLCKHLGLTGNGSAAARLLAAVEAAGHGD